jgi:formate-dependent nitrite reductase membrane component NrfD
VYTAGPPAEQPPAPPVKEAPWEWYYIPVYFWLGGVSAGSWLAATAEDVAGDGDRDVVRAGRYLAFGGVVGGTALLILDLRRPERFLNMLRIFRARSAMSLGSWGLAGFGALSSAAAALQLAQDLGETTTSPAARLSRGWPGRALHLAGLPLALFVGSYTGTLLTSTATPAWARRKLILPPLFVAAGISNGLAAVSAAVELTGTALPGARRRLARAEILALAAELALAAADRTVARSLPAAHREATPVGVARGLALGAGGAAPLVARVVERTWGTGDRARGPARWLAGARGGGRRREDGRPAAKRRRVSLGAPDGRSTAGGRSSLGALASAGLVLAGGLALRILVVHEGKRSAELPADTWAFAGGLKEGEGAGRLQAARRQREELAHAR